MYMNTLLNKTIAIIAFFLVSSSLIAQTGPGGIGSTDGTSSLNLWLNPDIGITTSTGVSSWADQSGYNHNVSAPNTTNEPSEVTGALNGHSVIRFDGSDDYLKLSLTSSNQNNYTLFFVWKWLNSSPKRKESVFASADNYSNSDIQFSSDGTNFIYKGLSGSTVTLGLNSVYNAYNITTLQRYTGGNFSTWRDGTAGSTYTGSSTWAHTFGVYKFGINRGSNTYLNYDLAEAIIFYEKINSAQRIIIENYLSAKYGITISNDIYTQDDNGAYDYDVAGIGRVDASNIHNDAQGTGIVRINNPSGLDDNEFLMWGHDNGDLNATEKTDVPSPVVQRFDRVWRVSEVNTSGTSVDVGTIDISWDLTSLGTVTVSDLRLLIDTDNDGSFADETPISGATHVTGNVYKFSGVSAIANNLRFTLGTINNVQTPLPIELLSFDAKPNHAKVLLNWQTATETNNDFFTIERSQDAKQWEGIAQVDGAGNSNKVLSYSYTDKNPLQGVSYYRLKQTDYNGSFDYSAVRKIALKQMGEIKIYPNPTQDKIQIENYQGDANNVQIYNAMGQNLSSQIGSKQNQDLNSLQLDLSALPTGVYFIRIGEQSFKVFKK